MLSADVFWNLGLPLMRHNCKNSTIVGLRRFRAMFGTSPYLCAIVWNRLSSQLPESAVPVHLLWSLIFLKSYNTEEINRVMIGADEKTIRKWIWIIVNAIANLRVVMS